MMSPRPKFWKGISDLDQELLAKIQDQVPRHTPEFNESEMIFYLKLMGYAPDVYYDPTWPTPEDRRFYAAAADLHYQGAPHR